MKIYVHTIGCKLNYFESEAVAEDLRKHGHDIVHNLQESDTVIVNTCTVTAKADSKSRQEMKKAKRLGKQVIATGCYATTDFETLTNYDYIDQVIDNKHKLHISDYLEKTKQHIHPIDEFPVVSRFERTRAFIKIQDGCNKFCSYCKIPYARGRSLSYHPDRIQEALEHLIAEGYKEIVITGVNISDYHFGNTNLTALVELLLKSEGDYRLRLSSLQPDEFDLALVEFVNNPRFARHFHLSLQSGSDGVLKRMNRHYTRADFLNLVHEIRKVCPDCGITTDIIVGFPGETDYEFEETLLLVKKAVFTRVHLFPYSPREGTPAARKKDIPLSIKKNREIQLRKIVHQSLKDFLEKNFLNQKQNILIETHQNGISQGYNSQYLKCSFVSQNPKVNVFTQKTIYNYTFTLEGADLID